MFESNEENIDWFLRLDRLEKKLEFIITSLDTIAHDIQQVKTSQRADKKRDQKVG